MEIRISVHGVTPLLLHAFTDADQQAASGGNRSSAAAGDRGTPLEQAATHLYKGADGKTLIIPQPNLFSCIIEGGKFFKAGKSKVTTLRSSLIPAAVAIHEIEIELIHKEPWSVDTRPVRIPATGGRILRHRPIFNDWQLNFSCELDTSEIGVKLFRQIIDAAGSKIGLGDFRPATKGPYGRFRVIHWVELAEGDEEEPAPVASSPLKKAA